MNQKSIRQLIAKVCIIFTLVCIVSASMITASQVTAQGAVTPSPQAENVTPTPEPNPDQLLTDSGRQTDADPLAIASEIDYNSLYATAQNNLWRISPDTGTFVFVGNIGYQGTDIAFDGKDLYAISFSQLLSIDPVTGSGTVIGQIGYNDVNALAVSRDGTMYGGTLGGALLKINKDTGAGTLVGYYGAGLGSSGDLAIRNDGTMFASVMKSGDSTDWLAQIDINTGKATLIGDIGEAQVYGMDAKDWVIYGVTSGGYLLKINPATGQSTRIGWTSAPFWGLATSGKQQPPMVIVHGWQGLPFVSDGYQCNTDGVTPYDGFNSTLGKLPDWFTDEYEVYIAYLDTSPSGTPPLVENAKCLQKQLEHIYSHNQQPITIVAHSMGGLVSRAALYYIKPEIKIKALYTLGSPHAGHPFDIFAYIPKLWGDEAALNMASDQMKSFNHDHKNKAKTLYYFLGGSDTTPSILSLDWIVRRFVGPNDGFVGSYSSIGWVWDSQVFLPSYWDDASPPHQYWTDEAHIPAWGNSYYSEPSGRSQSFSFECMDSLMKDQEPQQSACTKVEGPNSVGLVFEPQATTDIPVFTEIQTGQLTDNQSISLPLDVDTASTSLFYFTYDAGNSDTPIFTLTRPDGQLIDPAYAAAHPSEVTYVNATQTGGLQYKAYQFSSTQAGQWLLNITAIGALDYQAFATFESQRSLTVQMDKDNYQIGETATITAQLDSGGASITGATVTATLTRPDGIVDVVPLIDQGNGTYTNTYSIPDAPGNVTIEVTAFGTDNGTSFSRHKKLLIAIAPDDLQLTGVYADQPRDDNSNGFYDYLDFMIQANLASAGEYAISAELYAGDRLIIQSGGFYNLQAGLQTITLSFDGGAIRDAKRNGPYTVKNVVLTPIDIGIPAANVESAWTTPPYSYTQFEDKTSPQVSSVKRASPSPTNAASVKFTVTFSEPVTGVNANDFVLTPAGIVGAYVTSVSGSGASYVVTVDTGSGGGTLRLNVLDDGSIIDGTGNPLGGFNPGDGDFTGGETYTITTGSSFNDVPDSHWAGNYIERLYGARITGGCGENPLRYCPDSTVTRAQMSIFLLKGIHGSSYTPPSVGGSTGFGDVQPNHWAGKWIKQLAVEKITGGCGNGNYCPDSAVTRAQMAIFLLKAKYGASYSPPTVGNSTGFGDVPADHWAAKWIKQLAAEGITGGCGSGNYCPDTPVTRAQMAVFLVKTFNLP